MWNPAVVTELLTREPLCFLPGFWCHSGNPSFWITWENWTGGTLPLSPMACPFVKSLHELESMFLAFSYLLHTSLKGLSSGGGRTLNLPSPSHRSPASWTWLLFLHSPSLLTFIIKVAISSAHNLGHPQVSPNSLSSHFLESPGTEVMQIAISYSAPLVRAKCRSQQPSTNLVSSHSLKNISCFVIVNKKNLSYGRDLEKATDQK